MAKVSIASRGGMIRFCREVDGCLLQSWTDSVPGRLQPVLGPWQLCSNCSTPCLACCGQTCVAEQRQPSASPPYYNFTRSACFANQVALLWASMMCSQLLSGVLLAVCYIISMQHCAHRNTFIAICSLSATKCYMGKLLIFTSTKALCLICFLVHRLTSAGSDRGWAFWYRCQILWFTWHAASSLLSMDQRSTKP